MALRIDGIDHLAITVADMEKSIAFYTGALGGEAISFGAGRKAVRLGRSQLNLHDAGTDATPVAAHPTPGAIDVCFLTQMPVDTVIAHLRSHGVEIEDGPVERTGSEGPILSVYVRDPDGNLIEISNRL